MGDGCRFQPLIFQGAKKQHVELDPGFRYSWSLHRKSSYCWGTQKPGRGKIFAPSSAENAVLGEASHIGWVFCIPSWPKKMGFNQVGGLKFFDFPEDLTDPGSWDPRSEMPPWSRKNPKLYPVATVLNSRDALWWQWDPPTKKIIDKSYADILMLSDSLD